MSKESAVKTVAAGTTYEKKFVEKTIIEVLDAFMKQEMGNKVTQFNMQGLVNLTMMSLENPQKGE